jgi:RluA family pseudouridine synthase
MALMLQTLYLDDALVVVNKPPGLSVLVDGWNPGASCLLAQAQDVYGKLWVVHRLDKVTSGVLLLARTPEIHRALNRQLETREVQKLYHAIVNGSPAWEHKTARHGLRIDVGHKHRTAIDPRNGKQSETRFRVVEDFRSQALLEAHPVTGRTHQIRAHAAALGHPLLGDALYGGPLTDLIARPALHALKIEIVHPSTGLPATFEAPYPPDFELALETLRASRGRLPLKR